MAAKKKGVKVISKGVTKKALLTAACCPGGLGNAKK